jgi:hypothetical protein
MQASADFDAISAERSLRQRESIRGLGLNLMFNC